MKALLISILSVSTIFCSTVYSQNTTANKSQDKQQASSATKVYNLESIANLFLQNHAATNLSWQRDIQMEDSLDNVSPYRLKGVCNLGYYSFRPATVDELTELERKAVLDDPRFLSWIEWFSGKQRLASRVGKSDHMTLKTEVASNIKPSSTQSSVSTPDAVLEEVDLKYLYTIPEDKVISNNTIHLKLDE